MRQINFAVKLVQPQTMVMFQCSEPKRVHHRAVPNDDVAGPPEPMLQHPQMMTLQQPQKRIIQHSQTTMAEMTRHYHPGISIDDTVTRSQNHLSGDSTLPLR